MEIVEIFDFIRIWTFRNKQEVNLKNCVSLQVRERRALSTCWITSWQPKEVRWCHPVVGTRTAATGSSVNPNERLPALLSTVQRCLDSVSE